MGLPFEGSPHRQAASVTAAEAEAHSAEVCGIVLANATGVNDCTINGVYKKTGTDSDLPVISPIFSKVGSGGIIQEKH